MSSHCTVHNPYEPEIINRGIRENNGIPSTCVLGFYFIIFLRVRPEGRNSEKSAGGIRENWIIMRIDLLTGGETVTLNKRD